MFCAKWKQTKLAIVPHLGRPGHSPAHAVRCLSHAIRWVLAFNLVTESTMDTQEILWNVGIFFIYYVFKLF